MKTERGFTLRNGHDYCRPNGYVEIESDDAPYRFVWLNKNTRAVLTFCEGDLIKETCESDEELAAHLQRLRDYYGRLDEEAIADAA